jgi:hypothetical protein
MWCPRRRDVWRLTIVFDRQNVKLCDFACLLTPPHTHTDYSNLKNSTNTSLCREIFWVLILQELSFVVYLVLFGAEYQQVLPLPITSASLVLLDDTHWSENTASRTKTILHLIIESVKYSRSNNATSITILINKQPRLSYYRPPSVRHIFRTSCFRSVFLKLSCMEKPLSNLPYSEELPMGIGTQCQEKCGKAQRLLQYCQLLGQLVLVMWPVWKTENHSYEYNKE